ncbi:MAG: BrnT family toxin [Candidatus Binatia bacterium]
MEKPFQYRFDWDPSKARQNLKDHGIAFERAATVFLDPQALSEFDKDHSQEEDRWITLGLDRAGTLLVVSHTYREETENSATLRLISARGHQE